MVQKCDVAECANEGKSHCSRCKKRLYCSGTCQQKDWPAHKKECKVPMPRVSIVDIPGKGKGVIAEEHIFRGTLIVSERPRIILPEQAPKLQEAISRLSEEDMSFIMSFPGPEDNPIVGRFQQFMHCVGDDGTSAKGLSSTICRVNHTCHSPKGGPNATYFWNDISKEEALYAIKEIRAGHEIEVSYKPNPWNYESLREKYGFECRCAGCARPPAERLASAQRIRAYNDWANVPKDFGRMNPFQMLKDIEKQILIICEEGYFNQVGPRAQEAFKLCAAYSDESSAQKWGALYHDYLTRYRGLLWPTLKEAKHLAAKPRSFEHWGDCGIFTLRGPSKQVLECFYLPEVETVLSALNKDSTSGNASVATTGATQTTPTGIADKDKAPLNVTKGQKKKAKAKAKKAGVTSLTDSDRSSAK